MEKQNIWFVAIVAVVAVVGIVLMVSYSGGKAVTVGEGDLAGEAISASYCKDECSPYGSSICLSNMTGIYVLKCGNFDTDSCMEWNKAGKECPSNYVCTATTCVDFKTLG